jgi:hypothetical protein
MKGISGSKFEKELSHTLNEMKKNGEILYHHKFWRTMHSQSVIADDLVITNQGNTIFFEAKQTSTLDKIGRATLEKPEQVELNQKLTKNTTRHIYIVAFYANGDYFILNNVKALVGLHKSYYSIGEVLKTCTFVNTDLHELIFQYIKTFIDLQL